MKLSRTIPALPVMNIEAESWQERQGVGEHPIQSGAGSFLAGTASCRVQVDGLEQLFQEYRFADVLYDSTTTIETRSWGERDFSVLDLHRHLLTFFEIRPLPGDA